jgi:predicted aldo/keto reductase-like oxidoreductase
MLSKDFEWETAQMPVNLLDHHYRSFQSTLLPKFVERNIGLIGMKSQAGGGLLKLNKTTPEDNIRYSLSMPISTLVSGMDSIEVLEENLRIVRDFEPLTPEEIDALLDATMEGSADGVHEHYKS